MSNNITYLVSVALVLASVQLEMVWVEMASVHLNEKKSIVLLFEWVYNDTMKIVASIQWLCHNQSNMKQRKQNNVIPQFVLSRLHLQKITHTPKKPKHFLFAIHFRISRERRRISLCFGYFSQHAVGRMIQNK